MHPKEVEHQERKLMKQMERDKQVVVAGHITNKYGLRYCHIRPKAPDDQPLHRGGVTVAYHKPRPNASTIEVSTAVVHPRDSYCRRTGRLAAALHFEAGRRIQVRVPKNVSVPQLLAEMFQPSVW